MMGSILAEAWHWQPSEIANLDVDDLIDAFEDLQEIKGEQVKAIKAATAAR